MVILNEDANGNPPAGVTAQNYQQTLMLSGYPVTADPTNQVYQMTQWDGNARPGKCALAPDMTILACYVGDDDTEAFDAIQVHAAGQGM